MLLPLCLALVSPICLVSSLASLIFQVIPVVAAVVARLLEEQGIRWVRLPAEDLADYAYDDQFFLSLARFLVLCCFGAFPPGLPYRPDGLACSWESEAQRRFYEEIAENAKLRLGHVLFLSLSG